MKTLRSLELCNVSHGKTKHHMVTLMMLQHESHLNKIMITNITLRQKNTHRSFTFALHV